MDSGLSNQTFSAINRGKHRGELFMLPGDSARIYVTTHFELASSDLLHYHDEPHLTFILNGGVIDKRKNAEAELFSGGLMFFHAGEPHQTIGKTFPTKYVSLQFQPDFFRKNVNIEAKLKFSVEKGLSAKFAMLKIFKELSTNDEFTASSVEMLTLSLLEDQKSFDESRPVWINKILELLNDNWNENISLAEMANAAGVHPKTVSKFFPKYFNCTLGEYRRKLKIEKSLALIKSSKLSLTEIAYECGFYDQSHFTGIFKQLTGFRPKQFQKL